MSQSSFSPSSLQLWVEAAQTHSCTAFAVLLDISAASPLLGADGSVASLTHSVCDKLARQGTVQMQPSAAAPAQALEPQTAIFTRPVLAPLQAVPEMQIPAAPAIGPLSSKSNVQTLLL